MSICCHWSEEYLEMSADEHDMPITMETATIAQQEASATQKITSEIQSDSDSLTQVNEGVAVVSLPNGQPLQVQGVIQSTQPSVIQSPQIQTVQVASDTAGPGTTPSDSQKRREILSRRPSYRKILNELSSDVPAVPKIEEEERVEEEAPPTSSVATVTAPSSVYQTSSGQYIAFTQGGAIQLTGPGGEALQGVQALTLPSPATPQPGATILQYGSQPGDPGQQLLLSAGQVLVQKKHKDASAASNPPCKQKVKVHDIAPCVVEVSGLPIPSPAHLLRLYTAIFAALTRRNYVSKAQSDDTLKQQLTLAIALLYRIAAC
ncbi:cAMP-responsive element modulator-like [Pimephales promelas]|uniref:cAMP-responsive element modulator-like n=1 Tax=Pimephales promelas TaxID=90988 RepID=UPI001955A2AC|nr:cAMP-responsive element modulator-like [Pimephales promelas]